MANNTATKDVGMFTRALWWIAGASPEILEKYPSEYSKFSAIGMTIAMTCLVAFVSGMAAAWYFSSNVIATIGFGIFWALLIFCIDRALVVTMKKSVLSMSWQKRLGEAMKIIIPRALLAVLVALLMSIPLELIVFEDIINTELPNYESKKLEDASKIGYEASRKSEIGKKIESLEKDKEYTKQNREHAEQEKNAAEKEVSELSYKLNNLKAQKNNPETVRYRSALAEVQRAKVSLKNSDLNQSQRSALQSKIKYNTSIMNDEKKKWNEEIEAKIKETDLKLTAAKKKGKEKDTAYKEARTMDNDVSALITNARKTQSAVEDSINVRVDTLASIQKRTNRFILHYSVLEYAVHDKIIEKIPVPKLKPSKLSPKDSELNTSVEVAPEAPTAKEQEDEIEYKEEWHYRNRDALTMLWLIRILFFIFEMMPTVVKAVSKPGPYERECQAQDEQMEKFFTSNSYKDHMQTMLNNKLLHEKQLADDRRNAEKLLHDHILSEIQKAQKDVADDAINKWRKEQLRSTVSYSNSINQNYVAQTSISTAATGKTGTSTTTAHNHNQNESLSQPAAPNNQSITDGDEFD